MDSDTTKNRDEKQCCQGAGVHGLGRLHGSITLVLILLAAFLFAATINSLKEYRYIGGGVTATNVITVSGEGEQFAVPDTAEFTFAISEEGETAAGVQEVATNKANSVIEALNEQGVENEDIKTVSYELHPKYEWEPAQCLRYPCTRKQVQKGFSLNQSIRVKVNDLDKAGELLGIVAEKEVASVSGLAFTVANEEDILAETRKMAIDDARAKAEKLAGDLEVSLVRIVGFNEGGSYPAPTLVREAAFAVSDMAVEEALTVNVPAGENRIVSNVTITYEIR